MNKEHYWIGQNFSWFNWKWTEIAACSHFERDEVTATEFWEKCIGRKTKIMLETHGKINGKNVEPLKRIWWHGIYDLILSRGAGSTVRCVVFQVFEYFRTKPVFIQIADDGTRSLYAHLLKTFPCFYVKVLITFLRAAFFDSLKLKTKL